jgi:hypothetical protein
MYAINHTTHQIFSYSDAGAEKVRALKSKSKKKKMLAFYTTVIKSTVWSFEETYEEAKATQAMLFLSGAGQ